MVRAIWPCQLHAVNYTAMRFLPRAVGVGLLLCLSVTCFGSAYNAHPKLIVIIVIDQFRGDYLERYRDQFGEGGFRLLLDHGAYFTDCNYDYANTRTAPGHATLGTGAYSNGHGILANEWWDPQKKRTVTSVVPFAASNSMLACSSCSLWSSFTAAFLPPTVAPKMTDPSGIFG